MITSIALLLFLVFLFLSGLHIYWGFGGRWAGDAVIPTKDDSTKAFQPRWFETLIVALGLLAIGLFILVRSGMISIPLPSWLSVYGLWIIAGIFLARAIGEFRYVGFFKRVKHTRFARKDTLYYSPLCLVIAILTAILAYAV